MTLAEAAVQADALASEGDERALSQLRAQWDEELESAARSQDFRERAVANRAIGQFRFRTKIELLRRGLDDDSPAVRGSALLALELLSRDHPKVVNDVRALLHELVTNDGNEAVRRLGVVALRNGSSRPDTIQILSSLGDDDEQPRELRDAATKVAQLLRRKATAKYRSPSTTPNGSHKRRPGSRLTSRSPGRSSSHTFARGRLRSVSRRLRGRCGSRQAVKRSPSRLRSSRSSGRLRRICFRR